MMTGNENVAEIKLESLTILNVQDGDLVVIRLPGDANHSITAEIQDFVYNHFDQHGIDASCMIIPNDADISVLRPAPTVAGGDADEKA